MQRYNLDRNFCFVKNDDGVLVKYEDAADEIIKLREALINMVAAFDVFAVRAHLNNCAIWDNDWHGKACRQAREILGVVPYELEESMRADDVSEIERRRMEIDDHK